MNGAPTSQGEATWTIQRVLVWTAERFTALGLDGPRLQADLLLAHALGTDRLHLYMDLQRPLDGTELGRARELVRRRVAGEPTQHLVGSVHFYGRLFGCDRRALIPRPETEILVEACLGMLLPDADLEILDVCCGSGVIGLSLLAERPRYRADLADLSGEACELTLENGTRLGLTARAQVHRGDLFSAFPKEQRWNAIVANPPYLESESISGLAIEVRDHDPRLALDGGPDGLDVIRPLALEAGQRLFPEGLLALEIGDDQGPRVSQILADAGWSRVRVLPDLARHDRVVLAEWHR